MKNSNAIILILISIGLFYTFIDPQYQKTKALRAEADQYENVLENVEALSETRDQLLARLSSLPSSEIERLSKVLPDNIDTVRLALDLDSIAAKYGITLRNVQVETRSDENTNVIRDTTGQLYESIKISFTLISNYENFRKFLGDVERSIRLSDIRTVSFRTTETGLTEYKIIIETYWLKK